MSMSADKSALNPGQRTAALKELASQEFDILVIGGGVTGSGIALDAISRGLTVAMVEAKDLASGTSSRSSKLIHGGLRYLEQYDFKLVREALQERELMVTTQAPHLVKPVPFIYPLTEKVRERTYVGAGMALYDVLRGLKRALPNHKHLSQKRLHEIAPSLRVDIVTGGFQYFDAQVDDARHTMMIARTAAHYGAVIATNVSYVEAIRTGRRVTGAKVRDELSGKTITVLAKSTILAGGVWTDSIHDQLNIKPSYSVTMSKGVHIVLPKSAITSESGVILKTPVSVLFIIPWADKWIVGTTDTPYIGDPREPLADHDDVQYILDQANKVLTPKISEAQILGVYAGLRPLVTRKTNSPTTKLSREHIVDHPLQGFVSIAGGKYTTYRVMAEDAVDVAAHDLRRKTVESPTKEIPILGAEGYKALINRSHLLAQEVDLHQTQVIHLLNRYGSKIIDILDLIKENKSFAKPLRADLPYLIAEIHYAASHEGAMSVDDVLARRTRLSFETDDHAMSLAEDVAKIISPVLGWSAAARKKSIESYIAKAQTEIRASERAMSATTR